MRKNHTDIICIIDRSGSMEPIRQDAIGGFNAFLKSQREIGIGTATLSLILFDHEYQKLLNNVPIDDAYELTNTNYVPRGQTALLDAIGRAIDDAGDRYRNMNECDRPEKVLVCILTDGQENASREYRRERVKEMIEHQQSKYNWAFVFLAANQDAFAAADNYGILRTYTQQFTPDSAGTKKAFADMGVMACAYRSQQ